jgi:hypothetical protein
LEINLGFQLPFQTAMHMPNSADEIVCKVEIADSVVRKLPQALVGKFSGLARNHCPASTALADHVLRPQNADGMRAVTGQFRELVQVACLLFTAENFLRSLSQM